MVTFTGVAPSVSRTTPLVVHPDGAVLACAWTRVIVTALSTVHVEPVQVLVNAPGRKIFCSARGDAVTDSPLIVMVPALMPLLLIPETNAVFVLGADAPHVKLKVSTNVVVLAGIGAVQDAGICASEPLRHTSHPDAPGGSAGRVTVTVWFPLVVFTLQAGPSSVIPVNGEKEIVGRSVATMKYCRPVVTGTEPPLDTTQEAGAAGVDIK